MTTVRYEFPQPLPASHPDDEQDPGPRGWVARLRAAAEIANYIGDTDFVKPAMRGNYAAIAAAILYGQEIGVEPMRALQIISIIKGNPAVSAEGQRAKVLAEGHEIWFEETTVTRAIAAGRRKGSERIGRITFTMDDAKRAGLAGQPNYRSYPAEMLRARASAALARVMFADVIGGLAAVEELEGEPENGIAPSELQTAPPDIATGVKPTRTRKRPAAREAVTPPPPPDTQPEPEVGAEPLADEGYKRRIFATMRDVGLADRQERLDYSSAVVGRKIESSNELTIGEASKLIDALDALAERKRAQTNEQEVIEALETELDAKSVDDRLDQAVLDALEQNYMTIPDLWLAVAAFRHKLSDALIEELHGRDGTGRLLWQPLRDNLRPDEAADLLATLAARHAEAMPDDIPY